MPTKKMGMEVENENLLICSKCKEFCKGVFPIIIPAKNGPKKEGIPKNVEMILIKSKMRIERVK